MKAIMMSVRPKWMAKILNGEKGAEVRKTKPKCDLPIDVYLYCTNGKETLAINPYGGYSLVPNKYKNEYFNGKVVAKFTLNKIGIMKYQEQADENSKEVNQLTCLTDEELDNYLGKKTGYGWYIDNLVIFDRPKELSEFFVNKDSYGNTNSKVKETYKDTLTRAPQSWQFIETEEN